HLDPASLTKIMTVYLACTKLDISTAVTMSDTAFQTYNHESGVLWIKSGESMTALAAEYASLLYSANDTTAMLAEAVSQDQDTFISLMNSTAASLNMGNTSFQNIFGLNNENNYSSAADLAKLVQAAIKNVTFKKIFSSSGYVMEATNMTEARPIGNDCQFLPGQESAYESATGCKIGSTAEGGYALAASAERNGTSLIAVVLGEADETAAYEDVRKILDYGFSSYHTVTLSGADVGTKTIEVYEGKKHSYNVDFNSNSEFSILLPMAIDKTQITMEMVTANEDSEDPNQITADVVFSIDGKEIGSVPMTAKITDVREETKEENQSQKELYFSYFCIAILGIIIIYDIARRITPPGEE
ncbi:MAG: D-alanyl-D-alanine carboxypeptidase, partial [Erysipelotrichia bacterium]|nr:D-alanyl-D-alanine carboxypeptidase [Erysipelotrichia bacterium]